MRNARDALAGRFEESRGRLRAVAYRMLGSLSEAEDAVQEAWVRLGRAGPAGIDNLEGWLTTVVARICLDALRARASRREDAVGVRVPEPIVSGERGLDPEQEALLAGSVGLALLVILDTLAPAERLAFVLHDLFAMPFEEIAPMVGRTPAAARQLASRARRRVQGARSAPGADPARQRELVDAFLAAARGGDLGALLAVLDPGVVLRVELGAASGAGAGARVLRGPRAAATEAIQGAARAARVRRALVNGAPGLVSFDEAGRPFAVLGFTFARGRIVQIDVLADPARLARVDLGPLRG